MEQWAEAPAKVNLFLEVRGRRHDGYHEIVSVFQAIDLIDRLVARSAPPGDCVLTCSDPSLPTDEQNLVTRAVLALRRATGTREGIAIHLEKAIPAGAGLGGGSSDAAAALRLANALWKTGLSREELSRIGADVGSDVPFFLWGGVCLCEGRGERVTPLTASPMMLDLHVPAWSIATASAYGALAGETLGTRSPEPFLRALDAGDPEAAARESYNRFEATVFRMEPRQRAFHARLAKNGAAAVRLSGSGSAVWSWPPGPEDAPADPEARLARRVRGAGGDGKSRAPGA